MGCEISQPAREYIAPTVDFETWSQEKLEVLLPLVEEKISQATKPTIVVFEVGHFMLPCEAKNLDWAFKNITFADALAERIIKKHKKSVKLLATLLVNNLDSQQEDASQKVLEEMFEGKKYLNLKSLKTLSERNLKNRAYKALKKNATLADSFINIDGKAYLKDEEYQHDLAAGFVDEHGNIIPRCGLILTSFLDKIDEFARVRMHPAKEYEIIFVSFSQEYHEYERVKLGVDIYTSTHESMQVTPIVMHWGYHIDQCLISHRNADEKRWSGGD
jgi:hypothetical protein